jgi:hypothetical protein
MLRFVGFLTKPKGAEKTPKKWIFINEINSLKKYSEGGTPVAIREVRRPCLARPWRSQKTNTDTKGTSGSRLRNLLFNFSFLEN